MQAATTYLIALSAKRNGIWSNFVEDSFSTRPNKVTELKATGEAETIQIRWTDIYAVNNYRVKIFSKDVFVHKAPILTSAKELTITKAIRPGTVYDVSVYALYKTSQSEPTTTHCSTSDFEYPFLNLTPGRLYAITLESCSNGEYSSPISEHKRIPPCKPMLEVSNTTEDSITVKWHSVDGQKEKYILQLCTNGKTFCTHEICDTEQSCHEHIFTDLTPDRNYKISAVTQIDNVTSKTFELDVKTRVPSPENLDIYEVGEDYITVNWTAVVGDITGYLLRIEAGAYDDESLERHCDANTTRYKLTPLISGRKYHISVFALSGSDRSTPRSTKQYTRVRPPGNLEVGPGTDFIRIDWTPPDGDVEWYDIAIADTFGNCVLKTIEGNSSSYTVTDDKLTPGTLYNVTLESRCGECRSGQPLMKQVTTTPVAPLLEVSRHDIGHEHATVYWSKAAGYVDRYMISLYHSNHGIRSVSKDCERKSTFYGLTPGKGYTIKIFSKVNNNIQSCLIEQRIFTRPFPPTSIDIKESDITETSMKVEWKSPPKGEVMKWYLQISSNTGTALSEHRIVVIQAQPSQHLYRYAFYGLRPGRLYDVGILAESGGQCGEDKKISRRTNVCKPKILVHKHAVGLKHITVECEPLDGDSDSCEVMIALATNPTVYVNGVTNIKTKHHWKHCFDALEPGTEYKISATAKSGRKRSESFNMVVRTCVDAPSNLRIDEQADGAIIRWSAAKGYVDGYKVTLSSGKEIPTESFEPASEDPNINFPHLVPGRMYKISVSSIIKQNEDEDATSTTVSSGFRAKIKMPKVAIDTVGTNSLKISWHDVTGERDRYRVSISPADSRKSETVITAPSINTKEKLTHVFENLTPGKMYTVAVVTITGEDESERDSIPQRTRPTKPKLREVDSVVNDVKYFTEWDPSIGLFDKYELTVEPVVCRQSELSPQRTFETKDNNMIIDLVRGLKYNLSLVAVSGEDNSLIETSTVTVLPAQPLDVNVLSTDTTITVTWKEPEGVKTGYVLKLFTKNPRTTKEVKNIKHGQQLETCFEKCARGREYELMICTVAGTKQSSPDSYNVQTVVSKPVVKVEYTDLSSIEVSWLEVDGDKTKYSLSIHESDGHCIESRPIEIKSKGWIRTKSYREIFDGLCPGRLYEIRAFTISGGKESDSMQLFSRTEVSPVRNLEIFQFETRLTVKWDPVFGDVDKYIVALEKPLGTKIEQVNVEEGTHTFDKLESGAKYHVRVKSVSGNKTSAGEEIEAIVRPCKPEDVSVVPNDPQSLKVSWKDAKGEKTHYIVTISPMSPRGNGETKVEAGNPLVHTYSGLTSGRVYTVTVETVSEGVEGYAVKVSQTTLVSAPCNVLVKGRLEENLTVSWTPGEGYADRYHVRTVPVGSSDSGTTSQIAASVNNTGEVVCSINALQPGTCYDIYVKAESNGRCSHESHTQAHTLIGRVTECHVSNETIESFKVSWVESRGQKTHYVLYVDPSNEVIVVQNQDKNLDYEFTGLQPGLEYKVVIRTDNGTEKSEPKELHAWTKPMPPKYVEITNVEQDSLTVRWCGPEDGGYDKFKVSINPPDDEAVEVEGEITEHMFSGLIAGRAYEISVSTIFHCLESTPQTVKRMTDIRPPTLEIQPNGISQEHITLSVMNHKCDCDEYKIMIESVETGDGYLKTARRETDEDVHVMEHLVPGRKYNISAVSVTQNQTSAVESISARTTPAKVVDMRTEVTGRTCTITWDETPGDKDGYYIQRLSKCTNAGSKREPIFVKSGQTPLKCTIRYLTPGRIYDVSVRTASASDEGTRTMSEPICRQVQTSVSKAVIECSGHTDTNITVKWLDVDGDKTSYKLWIIPSDGDNTIRDVPITTYQSQTHKTKNRETFTGLQPGRKYKIFSQTVSGSKESDESVIEVQTTVCPPQDVEVLTALEHSLPVTWSHAKGDKDFYKLSLLLNKTEVASDTVPAPAEETHDLLSYTFQNLSAGFVYDLEISTLSGEQCSVVKRYPAQTRPSPPQHVTISKQGKEGLRVTWDEAEGNVTYYGVVISPLDGWKSQHVRLNPEKSYEWTYSGLVPGRKYIVSVTAVSGEAASVPVVREETTVVAEPEDVKVEHREETRLTLSWNPAKGDKIGYDACIEPLVSEHSPNEVVPTNCIEIQNKEGPMSCTFDNLQPGRQYVMTLKTKSYGLYSKEVTLKARALVSPPKTLQVRDITTDNITLAWSEADGDKDYYQIKISPADGLNPEGNVKKDEHRLYTFSGLTAGKSYIVSIRTYSGGEHSHDKTISERTSPNAPENVVANIVHKGIQVVWQPVKGELDNYLLHLKPSKNTDKNRDEVWHTVEKCDPTSHIFPVSDLTFGRLYDITVETVSGNKNSSPFLISQRLTIDPPKDLKETRREERRIVVAWEAAIGDKDSYRVQLSDYNGLDKKGKTTETTWSSDELDSNKRTNGL
ncbi:receptor-type tyrosine-protein phosphatase beta-like [Branchiostoma floridae x Branchiostoma japonicum]